MGDWDRLSLHSYKLFIDATQLKNKKTERKNRKVRINRIQTNRYSDKKSKS